MARFTILVPGPSPSRRRFRTPRISSAFLSEYVDFGGNSVTSSRSPGPSPSLVLFTKLKKGMTESQVLRILGAPHQSREHQEGDLDIVTNTFPSEDESIEVDFVKGKVVDYRVRQR